MTLETFDQGNEETLHDQQKDDDKDKDTDKDNDKDKYIREHLQRATLETCDL